MKKILAAVGIAAVAAIVLVAFVRQAQATALSDNRDTPQRSGEYVSFTVASGVVIYAGAMVCENGSQKAVPASDSSGYAVVGRAEEKADNTTAYYSATKTVKVRRGVFRWANGDSFTDANVGDMAYVEDDQTVQKASSATYDIIAGVIIDVDDSGVWVDTFAVGGQGATSLSSLNVTGNGNIQGSTTLGGTLSATGAVTYASTLDVGGTFTASNSASLGTAAVTGKLSVANTAGFSAGVNVDGTFTASNSASLGTAAVTGKLSVANTAGFSAGVNVDGTFTASNNAVVGKRFTLSPATQPLAAGAFTLTPTNGIIDLQPCGVATVTLANAATEGDICTLVNNAATNIVIADSANLVITGAVTLGQYDNITIKARKTDSWVVTSYTDN